MRSITSGTRVTQETLSDSNWPDGGTDGVDSMSLSRRKPQRMRWRRHGWMMVAMCAASTQSVHRDQSRMATLEHETKAVIGILDSFIPLPAALVTQNH
jgi:hypothetical protein